MKKYFVKLVLILMILLLVPATSALSGKKKRSGSQSWRSPESIMISKAVGEKRWLLGRIKGNSQVITVKLEPLTNPETGYQMETSTNKFGYYAFSNKGQGRPSNYKLVIYRGNTIVKQVSLKGIRSGGRVPDIKLNY
ncbi:hypothetical protein [Desulfonema magnum]|uniref:Uncharacterized protein n=1 Tax=Desulfonema magnum TaxID=45655 RepID=A0A975GLI4_9BACT|nr:hypothetical protein [Desulfonema magnum]QTA84853.1 Uncharacterized protein dnm_008560 [Desulfonema magnum]